MNDLILDVDFNKSDRDYIFSTVGNPGNIHGFLTYVYGHDGNKAIYFNNLGGEKAKQYIDFGKVIPEYTDFSVVMWIKTHRGGCNGWPYPTDYILTEDYLKNGIMTPRQKLYGGVLLSNTDCLQHSCPGFNIKNMQQDVYFTVDIKAQESDECVKIADVKAVDDDRWHQVTVTINRKENMSIYVDEDLYKQTDISFLADKSIGNKNLVFGADTNGNCGIGEITVSFLKIFSNVLDLKSIKSIYLAEETKRICYECLKRPKPLCIFSEESSDKLMQTGNYVLDEVNKRGCISYIERLHSTISDAYNEFLLNMKKPDISFLLISDAHLERKDGERTRTYGKALEWANELHMAAFADCGDYSAYGRCSELCSFWNMVSENRKNLIPLICIGNHETLEKSSRELLDFHTGQLFANNAVKKNYRKFYYEYELAGYHFLVLSQYSDTYLISGYNAMWVHAADIKMEQMEWLSKRLEEYCGRNKPVFLFIHNADREVLEKETDGNYRDRAIILSTWSDAFYELIEKYSDVVLCTGHVHHGFGDCCGAFRTRSGYHVIDVPSFCRNKTGFGMPAPQGDYMIHTGYGVYIYGNKIMLRAMNFTDKQWLPSYDQFIEKGY